MVNLAGIIHPSTFKVNEIITLMGPLSHLKQNAGEIYRYKNIELSIWGASFSTQESSKKCALIDGKIFNLNDLKNELKSLGHPISSENQADILIHAYETWGENFLTKLNGYYVLALFDSKKEILLLARDPIGKKNLYFSQIGGYFLFSTEIKGLLATGIVPQTPSNEGLSSYLYFGYCPQDLTPIKDVVKLLPGHYLKVNLQKHTSVGQHWSYSKLFSVKKEISREEAYQELEKEFQKALQFSSRSKKYAAHAVPNLGSTLLLLALKESEGKNKCEAVSAFLEGTSKQFKENTQSIVNSVGLPYSSVDIPMEKALSDLVKVTWFQDEPISDPSSIQIWHLSDLVSKLEVDPILITALGWEEIAAGQSRYFSRNEAPVNFVQKISHTSPFVRNKLIIPVLDALHSDYKFQLLRNIDINKPHIDFLHQISLFPNKERKRVSPFLYRFFNPEIFTQRFHRMSQVKGEIDPFLYFISKTELPDKTLMQYERLSSPHKVEVYTPFLDINLLSFFASLPESIKGEEKFPGVMVKNVLEKRYHQNTNYLTESPQFPSFIESWRHDPHFREIFASLKNGFLVQEGIISSKWIKEQLGYTYLIPKVFVQLWSILVLEIWFQLYINRPIGSLSLDTPVQELVMS